MDTQHTVVFGTQGCWGLRGQSEVGHRSLNRTRSVAHPSRYRILPMLKKIRLELLVRHLSCLSQSKIGAPADNVYRRGHGYGN